MGNFTGSYHWKTLKDFVTQIFTAGSANAAVALEIAALPNRCTVGDIVVRTDLDNQWYICVATTGVFGADFTAFTTWEASLIGLNAIVQFPGLTTIQTVLDDALSGDTGGVGNPFDIITTAGFGIGAGVLAPVAGNVEAAGDVIAGDDVVATAGGVGAGIAAPAAGNVEALAAVVAGTDVTATTGGVGAGVAAPAAGNVEAVAQVIAGTGVVATTGNIEATAGNITTVAGQIWSNTRIIGATGLQAGVTVGDFVITRVGYEAVALVGNGALAANTSADETIASTNAMPATAIIVGLQPSAAMVAGSVLGAPRNDGAGNYIIRYANVTAAPIAVAADAAFGVLWIDTIVI